MPQAARIGRERDLGGRIVQHHDVTHAGRSGPASDRALLQHHHPAAVPGQLRGTGGAHDPAPDHGHIESATERRWSWTDAPDRISAHGSLLVVPAASYCRE